jgi:hypothetical protein
MMMRRRRRRRRIIVDRTATDRRLPSVKKSSKNFTFSLKRLSKPTET